MGTPYVWQIFASDRFLSAGANFRTVFRKAQSFSKSNNEIVMKHRDTDEVYYKYSFGKIYIRKDGQLIEYKRKGL